MTKLINSNLGFVSKFDIRTSDLFADQAETWKLIGFVMTPEFTL